MEGQKNESTDKQGVGVTNVQLCDVQKPEPQANEVRIKISYCGICGTDLHIIADEYPATYPVIIGHEYSGVVDAIGSEVENITTGDRVVFLTAAHYCGKCALCTRGAIMMCPERKSIGYGVNGAMASIIMKDILQFYIMQFHSGQYSLIILQ